MLNIRQTRLGIVLVLVLLLVLDGTEDENENEDEDGCGFARGYHPVATPYPPRDHTVYSF